MKNNFTRNVIIILLQNQIGRQKVISHNPIKYDILLFMLANHWSLVSELLNKVGICEAC